MRVHHVYIASTPDCPERAPELLALLDHSPELYYRIVGGIGAGSPREDEAGPRLALAAAHVVVVIVGRARDDSGRLAEELRLARDGFSRRIPVLAVLTDEAVVPRTLGIAADRVVRWHGEAVVDAIVECCSLAPVYRRRPPRTAASQQASLLPV